MPMPAIRAATKNDLEPLLVLMEKLILEDHEEGRRFEGEKARKAMGDLLACRSLGTVFVATDKGDVIGYLVLAFGYIPEFHGRDAFVDEFFVDGSHRGMGLGKKMLARTENAVKKLGIKALHLEVTKNNDRAVQFYRRKRFRDHDSYLMTKRV